MWDQTPHYESERSLTSTSFKDICAVIIDKAHCIAQWGGDFRTAYSEIGKLRAFFPAHIPILAVSATLNPKALNKVWCQLTIDAEDCFFLNLGNDCPNIAFSVQSIHSSSDYHALKPLLTRNPGTNPTTRDNLIKSIVFVNSVSATQLIACEVRSWFPQELYACIDFIHAICSPQSRKIAMDKFSKGETKILFATEAAGMVSLSLHIDLNHLSDIKIYRELTLPMLSKSSSLVYHCHFLSGSNKLDVPDVLQI